MTCPATLVLGARDQMTLAEAGRVRSPRRCRRGPSLLDAGHALMGEAPDALLAALRAAVAATAAA